MNPVFHAIEAEAALDAIDYPSDDFHRDDVQSFHVIENGEIDTYPERMDEEIGLFLNALPWKREDDDATDPMEVIDDISQGDESVLNEDIDSLLEMVKTSEDVSMEDSRSSNVSVGAFAHHEEIVHDVTNEDASFNADPISIHVPPVSLLKQEISTKNQETLSRIFETECARFRMADVHRVSLDNSVDEELLSPPRPTRAPQSYPLMNPHTKMISPTPPKTVDPKVMMDRLKQFMKRSEATQSALQDWDKQNGLPKSHSPTMVNSSRSRKQLQEGIILRKWNAAPLIDIEGKDLLK